MKVYGGVLFLAVCIAPVVTLICSGPYGGQALRAQTKTRRATVETKSKAAEGAVDLSRSRAYVFVGKTGLGHDHGAVGLIKSGNIRPGAAKDAGTLVFDMASFVADTPEAREYVGLSGEVSASTRDKVTENMLGPDVLDVATYPTATFAIRSAVTSSEQRPDGTIQYRLDGDFTLHGVTRPLRVNVESEVSNGQVRLRGLFTIRQTHFGIKPYSKALGAVGVADELKIWGDVWLAPKAAKGTR